MREHMVYMPEPLPPDGSGYRTSAYPLAVAEPKPISPFRAAFGATSGHAAAAALVVALPTVIVLGAAGYVGWRLWRGFREWQAERRAAKQRKISGDAIGVRDTTPGLPTAHGTVGGIPTNATTPEPAPAKTKRVRRRKLATA